MRRNPDFSGYATKNDIKCSDGRVIRKDAFKHNDGQTVPLVWMHQRKNPENVLGHAILENREDGVFAYGYFNDTQYGRDAKELVQHGDITKLSIYANQLQQRGDDVIHGSICEVSLVLAGANPGASIQNVVLAHSDEPIDDEAVIYPDDSQLSMAHADENPEDQKGDGDSEDGDGETVNDVFNSLTEKQKNVVYYMIGQALENAGVKSGEDAKHSATEDGSDNSSDEGETVKDVFDSLTEKQKNVVYYMIGQALENAGVKSGDDAEHSEFGGNNSMKHNIFDNQDREQVEEAVLTHDQMTTIINDARRNGSMREAFLAHADEYGIENIEYLFPDARTLQSAPDFIKREDSWVTTVLNGTHHTPFSRIKSVHADITRDEARARGYIKGKKKIEEVFSLLKRTTSPTTIYKKQKLDRDDVVDITDFDVVAWLKTEMRMMLNEEIARAILIGDGRLGSSDDKIKEDCIRPIWKDTEEDLYAIRVQVNVGANASADDKAKAVIRAAIKARKNYKGSGRPTFFTTEDFLTDMLLLEDTTGRPLYESETQLATKLRVKEIVTVPVMENQVRQLDGRAYPLIGIIVNLADYNVGADKGGAINMFDDFDIDYNQQKYLIETRCSGALVKPKSALVLEFGPSTVSASDSDDDDDESGNP